MKNNKTKNNKKNSNTFHLYVFGKVILDIKEIPKIYSLNTSRDFYVHGGG